VAIGDELDTTQVDAGHVRFKDGVVFHSRSGHVVRGEGGCKCATNEPIFHVRSYREAVPQLQLSLTDACNMGCTYCSFRDRVHADGKPVTMPLETTRRGIEFYRRRLIEGGEAYGRIDFGLAGETFLVRHLHEQVQSLIEDSLTSTPVSVVWSGPNVTNATLSLAPELADRLGPPQDISIDGPAEVHDRVRFYTNNRGGTYDHVRAVLERVLARHPDMGVSAVLTAYCTDFVQIFRHLFEDIGARNIYMKPVNARHEADYALNEQTLPAFQRGYLDLVEHILQHPPDGILKRLLALNPEDYFMRFVYRVKDRTVQMYRCGAGKSGAYVDTNGNLYACAHFIGKSGWSIGHVDTGVDEAKRREYLDMTVDSRDPCRSCFARYVCGGGCHYQASLVNNDISRPDEVKCELIRFLTKLAVRLVVELREQHPEVLDALPSPFGIDAAAAAAAADAPYVPMSRLVPALGPAPVQLGGPRRLRAGVRQPTGLSVRLALEDGRLVVDLSCGNVDEIAATRLWFQPYGGSRFTLRDLAVLSPDRSGRVLRVDADGDSTWLERPTERFRRVPYAETTWSSADGVEVAPTVRGMKLNLDPRPFREGADRMGFNLFVDLVGGGYTALALHEPFVDLPLGARGPLALAGPEASAAAAASDQVETLNPCPPTGLLPLGRWGGLQPNVC
jgi:radical SAM protein with 4Fe4S-binding SPASM domain